MARKSKWRILAIGLLLALVGACSSGGLNADAGTDFAINVGDTPTFDGCDSTGEIQNYAWVIIEAPDVMAGDQSKIIRETDPVCSFTLDAAMVSQEVGDWVVELTITDDAGNTDSDTVRVEVSA